MGVYDTSDPYIVALMHKHEPRETSDTAGLPKFVCQVDGQEWPCTARREMVAYDEERKAQQDAAREAMKGSIPVVPQPAYPNG